MADSTGKVTTTLSSKVSSSSAGGGREYLQGPPSDAEVQSVLKKIQEARRQTAEPADLTALDQAEQDAEMLYRDRASRAEWLSVAERVGNSLVRLGAAQKGLQTGVDMSHLQLDKPLDWEGKIDRYGREYDRDLGVIGKQKGQARQGVADKQKQFDTDYDVTMDKLKPELDFSKYKYGQEYDTHQAGLRDSAAFSRQEASLAAQEARADKRDAVRQTREGDLIDKDLRNKKYDNLQKQLKVAQQEAGNTAALVDILGKADDLSEGSLRKLEEKSPGILAKAGVTPEELALVEKNAEVPGRLYGTNVDEGKRKAGLDALVKAKRDEITNLRQALDSLLQGQGQGQDQGKKVTRAELDEYMKQYKVTEEQARATLGKSGYTIE